MSELAIVLIVVFASAGVLTLVAAKAEFVLLKLERGLMYCAIAVIIAVMVWVTAEVIARYIFNSPLEGHLEGAELLLPIIVFCAISFAQERNDHVGMTLITESLPPGPRRMANILTLSLAIITCSMLAYFSFKHAYRAWDYDDVTMSPPYWPTWPSAVAVPIGYALVSMRMYLQILQVVMPDRIPQPMPESSELHASE